MHICLLLVNTKENTGENTTFWGFGTALGLHLMSSQPYECHYHVWEVYVHGMYGPFNECEAGGGISRLYWGGGGVIVHSVWPTVSWPASWPQFCEGIALLIPPIHQTSRGVNAETKGHKNWNNVAKDICQTSTEMSMPSPRVIKNIEIRLQAHTTQLCTVETELQFRI